MELHPYLQRIKSFELPSYGELFRMAFTDRLTGLPNRWAQEGYFDHLANEGHQIGVSMLDIEGVKKVNDACGVHKGDEIIKETGAYINGEIRNADQVSREPAMAGRYGGDEYLLIFDLSDTREDRAQPSVALSPERATQHIIGRITEGYGKHEPIKRYNDWAVANGLGRLSLYSGWAIRRSGESFDQVKERAEYVKNKQNESSRIVRAENSPNSHGPLKRLAITGLRRTLNKLENSYYTCNNSHSSKTP